MASVKINCPNCAGVGLVGAVTESVCPLCNGKGTYSVSDTDTVATVDTNVKAAVSTAKAIVTAPMPASLAAAKVQVKGK